jgi:hypothetical protein
MRSVCITPSFDFYKAPPTWKNLFKCRFKLIGVKLIFEFFVIMSPMDKSANFENEFERFPHSIIG